MNLVTMLYKLDSGLQLDLEEAGLVGELFKIKPKKKYFIGQRQ